MVPLAPLRTYRRRPSLLKVMPDGKRLPPSCACKVAAAAWFRVRLPSCGETAKLEIVPLMVLVVKAILPLSVTIAQVDAVPLSITGDETGMSSPPLGISRYELMLPCWGAPFEVLAAITNSWLNAKPKGSLPVAGTVLARFACPFWLTEKETIWLAPGSVTRMFLPSGVNDTSAGVAALPLGSGCVEPCRGTSAFACCDSGTIRKPVMLGVVPPAFST